VLISAGKKAAYVKRIYKILNEKIRHVVADVETEKLVKKPREPIDLILPFHYIFPYRKYRRAKTLR
jgi:hypothetical protein